MNLSNYNKWREGRSQENSLESYRHEGSAQSQSEKLKDKLKWAVTSLKESEIKALLTPDDPKTPKPDPQPLLRELVQNRQITPLKMLLPYLPKPPYSALIQASGLIGGFGMVEVLLPYVKRRICHNQALSASARAGNVDILRKLLDIGADHSFKNYESVINAINKGRSECLEVLLTKTPASFFKTYALDPKAEPLLSKAIREDFNDCAKQLIPLVDVRQKGSHALQAAVLSNHKELIDLVFPYSKMSDILHALTPSKIQLLKIKMNNLSHMPELAKKTYEGFEYLATLISPAERRQLIEKLGSDNLPKAFKMQLAENVGSAQSKKILSRI